MDDTKAQGQKVSFKDTLNLPQTDLPIRPNAKVDDPQMIQRWHKEDLYTNTYTKNQGNTQFLLHDGPPYANGHIHTGHAYNKCLKDIIAKSQRMQGKYAPITPGWDCHGLPIELKVTEQNPALKGSELKKACRAYAQQWINVQREEFKRLGVCMDWDNPYTTMAPDYEAHILEAFGDFVDAGYIERKNKTVPWCFSCKTVLASAEIEYKERKDPSIYVLFQLDQGVVDALVPELPGKKISLVIWTTTPWTLPLNRAVLLKPGAEYTVLRTNDDQYIVVGSALADAVCAALGIPKEVAATFNANQLKDLNAHAVHPLVDGLRVPVLLDESVETGDGTACVHSAPGAGPIDYEIGVKNKLEIYSPIAPDGTYTDAIKPEALAGMPVTEGQWWVLKELKERGALLHKTSIKHSYPHCWRCHTGLIFRATKQWFFDLAHNNIKERALAAIDTLRMFPEKSKNRFRATVDSRFEWCLSRQRAWGVPIPALLCVTCDTPYTTKTFIQTIVPHVAAHGIEWWDTTDVAVLAQGLSCAQCNGTTFKKETDILDVWLDSGLSHYAVLAQDDSVTLPATLYLEGSDQHRGWFQSSLLTGVALRNAAPMQEIMTHGYVVDAKGHKMSKSLGNVVSPEELITQLGTDGLRMWAASSGADGDIVLSDVVLKNVQETFRKVRNTLRFLLSNMYDFDITKDAVAIAELPALDLYALYVLCKKQDEILTAYNAYEITDVAHLLVEYCTNFLSSFYLDIAKDHLYVEKADGHKRRATQTVCWYILDALTRLCAPILSFTAEQVSDLYQKDKTASVHLQNMSDLVPVRTQVMQSYNQQAGVSEYDDAALDAVWAKGFALRSLILKAIEGKRETGLIKHSLEARVTLYVDQASEAYKEFEQLFKIVSQDGLEAFLKEYAIVSQFVVAHSAEGLDATAKDGVYILVEKAHGVKCPRCWQWDTVDNEYGLCRRCQPLV